MPRCPQQAMSGTVTEAPAQKLLDRESRWQEGRVGSGAQCSRLHGRREGAQRAAAADSHYCSWGGRCPHGKNEQSTAVNRAPSPAWPGPPARPALPGTPHPQASLCVVLGQFPPSADLGISLDLVIGIWPVPSLPRPPLAGTLQA